MAQQRAQAPTPAPATLIPVTAHRPFCVGPSEVFAVQPGVALTDAMDALSLLIGTAQAAAMHLACTAESEDSTPGAAWAPVYLLDMAYALQSSIHSGLIEAQRAPIERL